MQNEWWAGLGYMYIGRRLRYSEVVPVCAMEPDRLNGGITPLLPNPGCRRMWVVRLADLATLRPQKKLWFWMSLMLGGCWSWPGCFGEKIVLLLRPRFEPQIFQHISQLLYWPCCLLWFEGNTKVHINILRRKVGIGCVWFMTGILGRLLWT